VTPTDSELIARALSESRAEAFGMLVERHQSAVRRFLRHLTRGDAALADDLAQETFIGAFRGLARFRAYARFETWLLGIAYNRFRSCVRRRGPEGPGAGAAHDEPSEPSAERLTDLQQDLASSMARLTEHEQVALRLCFEFGLTHAEIACALGWPLGTVKTHITRGKHQLRELLSEWNPRT
jgi:RNA polymerase sigma-70 factor (ECF subfamily)